MSATQILRLIMGIIMACLVAGAGFLWLNHSLANITSEKADLKTDTYVVGIDYAGIVVSQDVQVGQEVKKGDKLLELRSVVLTEAINTERIKSDNLLFKVNDSGNIVIEAVADGTVQQVNYRVGSYVPASAPMAMIGVSDSFYISAVYKLNAPDYTRIDRTRPIKVTLPDNTVVEASIFNITQQRNGDIVETIIKARLNPEDKVNEEVFSDGTPVTAVLKLDSSAWYQSVLDIAKKLLTPSRGGQ